jgi:hypothetical protein
LLCVCGVGGGGVEGGVGGGGGLYNEGGRKWQLCR